RSMYFALKQHPERQRFRHAWLNVIGAFSRVLDTYPKGTEAAQALYTTAELWRDVYRISRRDADLDEALTRYQRGTAAFHSSVFADDALWASASILLGRHDPEGALTMLHQILTDYPRGDMVRRTQQTLKVLENSERVATDSDKPDTSDIPDVPDKIAGR